ncbi:hypothetical protein QJS10_CPA03g00083 [Acorus calamus]|uniref:Transposase-associated domain-containing protein n=1 Tax=Acorus calamus TaxID=4465 RepID=A0AAV9F699_ACOCL|nr:hypothetical protein QJS10_CPA03g00083 [Acorus calamus]
MDKSWMFIRDRRSDEFRAGVASFLEVARNCPAERKNEAGHIRCPCQRCANRFYFSLETVEVHLYKSGIMSGYTTWISHGEVVPPIQFPRNTREHQFPRNIHEHNLPQPSGVDEEEDEEGLINWNCFAREDPDKINLLKKIPVLKFVMLEKHSQRKMRDPSRRYCSTQSLDVQEAKGQSYLERYNEEPIENKVDHTRNMMILVNTSKESQCLVTIPK